MAGNVVEQFGETLSAKADQRGIEYEGRWYTWGEIRIFGDKLEQDLLDAGCSTGGRIGIVIRNRPTHAASVVGMLGHGRSIAFIYPFLPPSALAQQVRELGAEAIIADVDDWPAIRDAVDAARCAGIELSDMDGGPSLVAGTHASGEPGAARAGAIEVLSSGTTGAPKRIVMPIELLQRAIDSAPGGEAGQVPEVQINIWPLGGVGGVCLLSAAAAHGTPLVIFDRFSLDDFMAAVDRHQPTMLGLNTTVISMIMDADIPPERLASVQSISGGSSHLSAELQDKFEERYGIPILWGLGATEFCGTIARWTPAMRERFKDTKRGSVGQAMPGVSLRAVDPDDGTVLPPGSEGLLEVNCPSVREGWVRTTDLCFLDEDGFLFHKGRHDGAIVRGGFKILPEEIVNVLRMHPAVADAAVVAVPDARLGEVPVAAVEAKPGANPTPDELKSHVRDQLAPVYVPTQLKIVDALPRTPSLKASLVDVRAMFAPD